MKKIKKNLKVIGTGLLFLNLTSCMNLLNKPDIVIEDHLVQQNSYYVLIEYVNEQWEIKEITIQPRARDNKNQEVLQITNQLTQIAPFFEENKYPYHCQSLTKYEGYHPCSVSKLSMIEESNSGHVSPSYVSDITMSVLRLGTAPGYQSFSKDKSVSYIDRNYSVVINEEVIQDILNETNLIETIKNNKTLIQQRKTVLAEDFGSMPNTDEKLKNYANNLAPVIEIGGFNNKPHSSITHFKVTVNDQGGGIGKIHIFLDNTRLNPKVLDTQTNADDSITKKYELNLPYGESVIKAIAYDHSNTNKSHPVSYTVNKDYYSQPTLHVLSIGIKKYNDFRNLDLTENDAKSIGETLIEQNNNLYKDVKVHYLTGTVTKKEIINKLKEMKQMLKPYDSFIFYAASHGYYHEKTKKYYLLPSDSKREGFNAENFESTLSQDQLNKLLMDLNTANKLIVLDTCHSGQEAVSFEDIEIEQENIAKDLGISIITAAKKEELSWENTIKLKAGVFTHYFTEALKNKGEFKDKVDKNHDSIIDSFELYNIVKKYSAKFTKDNKNTKTQHASYFQSGRAFEISLLDKSKKPKKLQPKNFTPEQIQLLYKYSDDNNTEAIQKIYNDKNENIKSLNNALKAETQFKEGIITKKQIDRLPFTFGEKYIFLGLKDVMKSDSPQLYYDNRVNRYLLYADFYSDTFINHSNTQLDTPYIEKVDVGWHDVFYRVTMHLRPNTYQPDTMSYELIKANDGYFFNIK